MYVARLLRVEFGVLLLLFVASLARQLWRHFAAQKLAAIAGSAEGWLLLIVVVTTAARYGFDLAHTTSKGSMPGVGTSSLATFGVGCAIYLGIKAIRAVHTQS